MAFTPKQITKELDMANLAKHNDNLTAIKTELDAHESSITSHIAAQTAHGSTAAASPGKIVQRDSAGRAKVNAPAAADDIARKAEVDAVQGALDTHEADADVHLSAADRTKLDGIEDGAEPNQNAFAQVNNVVAGAESDTLTIAGGTGITVTTNPTTKTVTVTATGDATPGAHGSSHNNDGADPIPDLVALRGEFDALTAADIGAETPAGAQAKVDALAGEGNTKTVAEVTAQLAEMAKPTISFCFDDGYVEDNLTYSIFKEFGLVCSFALVTDYAMTRNRIDYYRQYEKEGFSINSHSCTHLNMSSDTESLGTGSYEIEESKKKLNYYGIPANGFVAPDSITNDKYMSFVRNNYDYAFTKYLGVLPPPNIGHIDNKHDVHQLFRVSLTNNSTDAIKAAIDNCIAANGCLFFYDHRTGFGGSNVTESKLREILTYVKSKVDADECVVMNNEDAVSSFFGVNLTNKKLSDVSKNLASPLSNKATAVNFNSWYYSPHGNSVGEVYDTTVTNNEVIGTVTFVNDIPVSKGSSLQTKIDLTGIDMTNYKKQTLLFSIDLWLSKECNLTANLNGRFYSGATMDATHASNINLTTRRQTYTVLITPILNQQFDYAMIYPYFQFFETVTDGLTVYFANPKVAMCNSNDYVINDGDSKWIQCSLLNSVVQYATGQELSYRQIGNVVYVRGAVKGITALNTVITNLPTGLRPAVNHPIAMPGSGNRFNRFLVSTSGDLRFENTSFGGTLSADDWYPINTSFLTD